MTALDHPQKCEPSRAGEGAWGQCSIHISGGDHQSRVHSFPAGLLSYLSSRLSVVLRRRQLSSLCRRVTRAGCNNSAHFYSHRVLSPLGSTRNGRVLGDRTRSALPVNFHTVHHVPAKFADGTPLCASAGSTAGRERFGMRTNGLR